MWQTLCMKVFLYFEIIVPVDLYLYLLILWSVEVRFDHRRSLEMYVKAYFDARGYQTAVQLFTCDLISRCWQPRRDIPTFSPWYGSSSKHIRSCTYRPWVAIPITSKLVFTCKICAFISLHVHSRCFSLDGLGFWVCTMRVLCVDSLRSRFGTEENQGTECSVFTEGNNGTGKLLFSSLLFSSLLFSSLLSPICFSLFFFLLASSLLFSSLLFSSLLSSPMIRISPTFNADTKCTGFCKIKQQQQQQQQQHTGINYILKKKLYKVVQCI